jgi:hypothetical protein
MYTLGRGMEPPDRGGCKMQALFLTLVLLAGAWSGFAGGQTAHGPANTEDGSTPQPKNN